jgi:hypothetical protein
VAEGRAEWEQWMWGCGEIEEWGKSKRGDVDGESEVTNDSTPALMNALTKCTWYLCDESWFTISSFILISAAFISLHLLKSTTSQAHQCQRAASELYKQAGTTTRLFLPANY